MAATHEVTQSEKSLIQAIHDGDVERPGLMGWNAWQSWRTRVGKKPTRAADGAFTSSTFERDLWEQVMEHFYGAKWDRLLARGEVPAEVVPAAAATSAAAAADTSTAAAANVAGAGVGVMGTPRRGESATKESPESGMGLGDPGLNSPGSGRSASWKSASPGSPGSLRIRIMSDFVPGNMNLEQYETKLRRMAQVLQTMPGEDLEPGQLEVAIERNRLISRMHEESGGDLALQNRLLSRELAAELLTIDNSEEQRYMIEAMEALLTDRGVDVDEIKTAVVTGSAVAPTPEKPASPAPGESSARGRSHRDKSPGVVAAGLR